jgi:uncharacterized protein YjbI with pentapeptide repeats/energy-coupling factor transporter ATP-binding protein EcfA2
MIQPEKAAVRPRVVDVFNDESMLLEDRIRDLLAGEYVGRVLICGPAGSGKTTALRHLAAVLPSEVGITLLDEPNLVQVAKASAGALQVIAAPYGCPWQGEHNYRLAPWNRDDLIEYLLHTHPHRCASVMGRIQPANETLLEGIPDLWQIVLECLAKNDEVSDVRGALHSYLNANLADTDLLERARSVCLNLVTAPQEKGLELLTKLAKPGFVKELLRALRHPAMRLLLAVERIAADLHGDADCDFLALKLPRELVKAAAGRIAGDERALEHLYALLSGPAWSHAMAVSLLHAAGRTWTPSADRPANLNGAYLDGVSWPGASLKKAEMEGISLKKANLEHADLSHAVLSSADLSGARLNEALLEGVMAAGAKFDRSILTGIWAPHAVFHRAGLRYTILDNAFLEHAMLGNADLTGASLQNARLTKAKFRECKLEGADFSGATLVGAWMPNLPLRTACFLDADFTEAHLNGCDLEGMDLPNARFHKANLQFALLTGSHMPDADFRGADLGDTGLAEIDWERADLCDADLRSASFHLGTSRSGLVGSPIACEGSRTGFYTDDYEEQSYKSPEEIRKANLRGADLRGARIDGVDFYLVDLRDAVLDPGQEEHVRRCGAILESRVP